MALSARTLELETNVESLENALGHKVKDLSSVSDAVANKRATSLRFQEESANLVAELSVKLSAEVETLRGLNIEVRRLPRVAVTLAANDNNDNVVTFRHALFC